MTYEYADGTRTCRAKREPREIPEFRRYLTREGLDFETWRKRQVVADAATQALRLARRKLQLTSHKGK